MKRTFALVFACVMALGQITTVAAAAPPMPVYEPNWMLLTDVRASRVLNGFHRDGYVEIDRQYQQINYLAVPKENYLNGKFQIILKNDANTDVTKSYYAVAIVDIMIDVKTGHYYTGRVRTEEFVFDE